MMSLPEFVTELRRRKVFRVGALYVVVAWGLIEAASVVVPELELPSWSVRLLIVLAVFALPLVLLLAWVFDITPQGVRRTDPLETAPSRPVAAPADNEHSIAVLPFVNIGGDAQDDYFCDGLAEDLLNRLARVDGLRVVARSSAFALRNRSGGDVREIAELLGVSHVLEGSVRRAGNRLRIAVRLVNARDAFQLWSETFDHELGDMFRIQDEISGAVFDAFNYQFAQPEARDAEPGTDDVEAYHLYLMGRHQFHKRTTETLGRAIEYFEQAIALDPEFALPYAGLSDAYALSSASGEGYGNIPVEEALARAEPLVQKALALDPGLAEAHASLGLLCRLRNDMAGAEVALRRSLELNDAYPLARTWLALTLIDQGRVRDGSAEFRKALESDPLSSIVITNLGFDRIKFGEHDEARRLFRRVIDLDPSFPPAYVGLAAVEQRTGRAPEAERWLEKTTELSPRRAYYRALLGALRVELGKLEPASRDIARAAAIAPEEPVVARAKMALLISTAETSAMVDYTHERLVAHATPESRANAALARLLDGDAAGARALYEQVGPDLHLFATHSVVWSWRFPHGLLYARTLQQLGDDDAAQAIVDAEAARLGDLRQQGLVTPQLDYLECALALLAGRVDAARVAWDRAHHGGWQPRWWIAHDPLLAGLRDTGSAMTPAS